MQQAFLPSMILLLVYSSPHFIFFFFSMRTTVAAVETTGKISYSFFLPTCLPACTFVSISLLFLPSYSSTTLTPTSLSILVRVGDSRVDQTP
jgi:hypothetical protein